MLEIIPAILEKDFTQIERKINLVKSFAGTIQIDLIDGKFLPQSTLLTPESFAKFSQESFLELHLMTQNPIGYVEPFAKAGFRRFIAHVEALPNLDDQKKFVKKVRSLNFEVGLAIDRDTEINTIKEPLENLDCLLIMLVKAGSSGQKFDENVLDKIRQLRAKTQMPIEVDGGINTESIMLAKKAGANRFSVNSFLFMENDPRKSYNQLLKCLE